MSLVRGRATQGFGRPLSEAARPHLGPLDSLCWLVGVPRKLSGLSLSFDLRILVSAFGFVGSVFSLGLELICFWMWAL